MKCDTTAKFHSDNDAMSCEVKSRFCLSLTEIIAPWSKGGRKLLLSLASQTKTLEFIILPVPSGALTLENRKKVDAKIYLSSRVAMIMSFLCRS